MKLIIIIITLKKKRQTDVGHVPKHSVTQVTLQLLSTK